MTMDAYTRNLARFGADLGRWPPAEAAAARQLLATSEAAQALLRQEADLSAAMRASRATADAETLARMRAHIARHIARTPLPVRAGRFSWLRPLLPLGGGALAALAFCGLWLSLSAAMPEQADFSAPRQLAMIESIE